MTSTEPEPERIVIRDNRKVGTSKKEQKPDRATAKPEEGEVVAAGPATDVPVEPHESAAAGTSGDLAELRAALDERTADLQRVTAEYANYRKRVDRDRTLAAEQAVGMVLGALLPVLDDLDRAREHGDLSGPFAAVAEQIGVITGKFGLAAFGEKGDPFDPNRHEAVAHLTSAEVTGPTCIDVLRRGYLLGDRLLRPAMVAVAEPEEPATTGQPEEPAAAAEPEAEPAAAAQSEPDAESASEEDAKPADKAE